MIWDVIAFLAFAALTVWVFFGVIRFIHWAWHR